MKQVLTYTLRWVLVLALLLPPGTVLAQKTEPAKAASRAVLIKNATLWTVSARGTLTRGDLLVRDGKVAQIGVNLSAPAGATAIDATDKHVTPGLIDCHSHSAISGNVNEGSNNITAEVRVSDVV